MGRTLVAKWDSRESCPLGDDQFMRQESLPGCCPGGARVHTTSASDITATVRRFTVRAICRAGIEFEPGKNRSRSGSKNGRE
jgi:hypothetical protein